MQASVQSTVAQAPVPEQVIAHFELVWQLILAHALAPVQLIVHVQDDGQITLPQLSAELHSIGQIFLSSSHIGQSAGHCGITQKPDLQTRPSGRPAQSAVVVHS